MKIDIAEASVPDTQDKLIAGRDHSRDETQVWVDSKVTDLVTRWTEAGTPEPSDSAPFLRLEVKKEERPELRRMINRAFTLLSGAEGAKNTLVPAFYQDAKGKDGKVVVKFNVRIKPEAAEEVPEVTAPAVTAGAADVETPQGTPDVPKPGRFGRRESA